MFFSKFRRIMNCSCRRGSSCTRSCCRWKSLAWQVPPSSSGASQAWTRAELIVWLGNGGDLALVEFKTGPGEPDFRECLAQLLDYGSDLWEMTLEEFVRDGSVVLHRRSLPRQG